MAMMFNYVLAAPSVWSERPRQGRKHCVPARKVCDGARLDGDVDDDVVGTVLDVSADVDAGLDVGADVDVNVDASQDTKC